MEPMRRQLAVEPSSGAAQARSRARVLAAGVAWCAAAFGGEALGQVTERVSVATGGAQGNSYGNAVSISADGRWVAFQANASNLVAGDTNGTLDVFVRDRGTGTTERVSVATGGSQGSSAALAPALSADGRFVVFMSYAWDLVAGDTNGFADVFVRDRQLGSTERVSVATGGAQSDGDSVSPSISADGRFVAFHSVATNLVAGDTNGWADVFVRDRQLGTTERVSVATGGTQANGASDNDSSLSADGRYVAFASVASNLVAFDTNGAWDVFVRDRQLGTTGRASLSTSSAQGNGDSHDPSISADGRFVAFESVATNFVVGDTNGSYDVFVRDRLAGTTDRASVGTSGTQGDSASQQPSISADGRFVAFHSAATNLVPGDTNLAYDIILRDRQDGTSARVSVDSAGVQGGSHSEFPSLSGDGRFVAFHSAATNLVPGDTNAFQDAFVHDRDATGFTGFCHPGLAGVIPCPCSNPPGGPDQGCNNSTNTGGAALFAAGIAYLSMDTLVFTTTEENPTATSIVLQGTAEIATGAVFGQGVRCVGGTLKRLYVKAAVAGGILAPDSGAGDASVSARSAALGDPIPPGESRYYMVYYRDPIVLGGCPATSTFNATPAGQVGWWP